MMIFSNIKTWEVTREEMCLISQYLDYIRVALNAGMIDEFERIRKELVMA
jgi:hypothetical protein